VKNSIMLPSWLLFIGFFALRLTAASPVSAVAADAKPGWQAEWERTIRAAEKEGEVSLAIFDQGPVTVGVVDAFQKAFPKIKVNSFRARGSQIGPRIIAERRAEKYLIDLFTGGKSTALSTLHAGKALDPIKPLLILPEVIDPSKWWQGKLRYVDAEEAYVLAFLGNGGGVDVTFNTDLVNPKELKSYWDLTNPKWKGKIVATDPRVPGQDRAVLYFYHSPALGPDFMRKLYGEMDIAISRDYRQPVDWLSVGKYLLCIPCNSREAEKAMKQGLPIAQISQFKEGVTLTSSGGTISFLNRAPHPNGAKVFVNWLLSRDAQALIQKANGGDSLRIDIAKEAVLPENRRQPGTDYLDGDDPKFSDRRPIEKLLNEILK
jgi:iron(III) transport system substrate-binding protein